MCVCVCVQWGFVSQCNMLCTYACLSLSLSLSMCVCVCVCVKATLPVATGRDTRSAHPAVPYLALKRPEAIIYMYRAARHGGDESFSPRPPHPGPPPSLMSPTVLQYENMFACYF